MHAWWSSGSQELERGDISSALLVWDLYNCTVCLGQGAGRQVCSILCISDRCIPFRVDEFSRAPSRSRTGRSCRNRNRKSPQTARVVARNCGCYSDLININNLNAFGDSVRDYLLGETSRDLSKLAHIIREREKE